MLCTRHLIVACMLVSTIVSPRTIQSARAAAVAPAPVILSASTTASTLAVKGSNFLPGTAGVTLGSFGPLTVVTQTATQLIANLPGAIPAGDYTLNVQIGTKAGNSAQSVVMIGAVGPQGPKVDTGATGAQGPVGPQGPVGINQKQLALLRWYLLTLLSVHQ